MQRLPQRVSLPRHRNGPHRPAGRRRPGQHREPEAAVCPLQPGEGRPAAGVLGGQVARAGDRCVKRADGYANGIRERYSDSTTAFSAGTNFSRMPLRINSTTAVIDSAGPMKAMAVLSSGPNVKISNTANPLYTPAVAATNALMLLLQDKVVRVRGWRSKKRIGLASAENMGLVQRLRKIADIKRFILEPLGRWFQLVIIAACAPTTVRTIIDTVAAWYIAHNDYRCARLGNSCQLLIPNLVRSIFVMRIRPRGDSLGCPRNADPAALPFRRLAGGQSDGA